MSAWSCPHDADGVCQQVAGARCDPGMRGCVLHGRVRFANADRNLSRKPVRAEPTESAAAAPRRKLPF